jgi:hypothetical protein
MYVAKATPVVFRIPTPSKRMVMARKTEKAYVDFRFSFGGVIVWVARADFIGKLS